MDLTKLAEMTDAQLKTYVIAMRDTMTAPYKCFWNTDPHKSSSQTKAFNYLRHVVGCKHRQDHTNQVISQDAPMIFPVYGEDLNSYRGCLNQMNGCYEFMYKRLGDRGWKTYTNKIVTLMVRFFTKYCNMGMVGYQQSVMFNGDKWKVKKNKDLDYIMLDSKQMFTFFINEFKPLLEYAMLNYVTDSPSFEFWYFIIMGERTQGQKDRMNRDEHANNRDGSPKITDDHYIDSNGKIVFTMKNGDKVYK